MDVSSEKSNGEEDLVLASTQTQAVSGSENTPKTSNLDLRAITDSLRDTIKIDIAAQSS